MSSKIAHLLNLITGTLSSLRSCCKHCLRISAKKYIRKLRGTRGSSGGMGRV